MKKILTPTNYELIPLNDKTNVRFFTSIDPGSYVAPHWHDAVEIVYLLEGELKVIVGNDSRNLKAGQCAMVTPNQIDLCSVKSRIFFRNLIKIDSETCCQLADGNRHSAGAKVITFLDNAAYFLSAEHTLDRSKRCRQVPWICK